MRLGYPAAAIRAAEAPLLDAGRGPVLMRTAAAGLAAVCRRDLIEARGCVTGARVVVLAGAGNNGGDALFAGADLSRRGARVTVVDVLGRLHPEGAAALRAAGGDIEPLGAESAPLTARAELVIDGILGTGASGSLRAPLDTFIADWQAAASGTGSARRQRVIAVDVPTGVDATTGAVGAVHVRADRTVTFGGHKAGLLLPGGADAAGELALVDIGLDLAPFRPTVEAPEPADLAVGWPFPQPDMHKYTRGVLGLVAGSHRYPGAGLLTTAAAVSTGLGMLRLLAPDEVTAAVLDRCPEVVTEPGRVQAWAVGPGAPDTLLMRRAIIEAENRSLPLVIDAGGLGLLTRPLETTCIVTPHAGELVDLLGRLTTGVPTRAEVEADPVTHAVRAAQAFEGVIALKGRRTIVARPDGSVVAPPPGPAALATAGSGDVLTGILGALLATTAEHRTAEYRGPCDQTADRSGPATDIAILAGLAVTVHGLAGHRTTHASGLPAAVEDIVLGLMTGSAGAGAEQIDGRRGE
ncbi:NAD(P)H-hydrate dehydratase [Brevibacterium sp. R8603A2]|uniref:NAD(P)H-hydrate dehydratase n=1 Tax=Brevibacterium sp. R8603A2 TaxID=2929779 RepID=UPI001FF8F7BF|nr:NAD(P)H-hydrate dehydratase [Brevibacterium sp. R8603A2]MCK1801539.1 NAD(P)H-hydrate dehydratase [Brevibacterium sp. R8603A2]